MAQALPNLAVLRVRYNAARTAARPEGDLKAQLDALDKEIAEALRVGRNGEVRRLLARGTTLLDGREWTDVEDFRHSLVLRAERLLKPTSSWSYTVVFRRASVTWYIRCSAS